MNQTIKSIISEIPTEHYFDAHTVIQKMYQEYRTVYDSNNKFATIEKYHSEISKNIDSFVQSGMIERIGESWSKNINGNYSECVCWKKK
ncbi:MAG: hypothetical protein IK094_10400 [Treponema sp.]|nr:hypothetical protein [Treponema sp.]